ncbi:MAG: deoxynucleoside kinase [Flavobacteriales bacterium]
MSPYRYIVIEGNIGAGKTSLATRISSELSARLILEEFADNPFLPKFYEQPERYAFPLELSFLSERFSQLKRDLISEDLFAPKVIGDYFINKCQIFAKNNLQSDEYNLFVKMYEIVESNTPKPDLLVYLYQHVDQLLLNIRKRGRDYEKHITAEYLENIQQQYLEFIRQHEHLRVVIIDTTNRDFVNNDADYAWIREKILTEYPTGVTRISG